MNSFFFSRFKITGKFAHVILGWLTLLTCLWLSWFYHWNIAFWETLEFRATGTVDHPISSNTKSVCIIRGYESSFSILFNIVHYKIIGNLSVVHNEWMTQGHPPIKIFEINAPFNASIFQPCSELTALMKHIIAPCLVFSFTINFSILKNCMFWITNVLELYINDIIKVYISGTYFYYSTLC